MYSPFLFHSPSSPSWSEGFPGARWGQPSAPSLPADVQPSCCPQGTRKGCILQQSAGKTVAGHVDGIKAGRGAEIWAQNNGGDHTALVCCYTANNPPLNPVSSVWENIQRFRRWLWEQRPIAHVNNNNCVAVGWTKERNLLSYFRTRLKGLRDTQTRAHTHSHPDQTQLNNDP